MGMENMIMCVHACGSTRQRESGERGREITRRGGGEKNEKKEEREEEGDVGKAKQCSCV